MHGILITVILVLGLVFLGLTVLIVSNKAWREEAERRRCKLRAALEPRVLLWAHGAEPALVPALGIPVGRAERVVLEDILIDHAQRVRGAEHEKLSRALEQIGSIDELVQRLGSRRWWQRAEAAEKLGLSGSRRASEHLIPCMRDPVPEVRMRAAKALGALGGTSPVRELVHALNEPNRWSTIRLADILTGMGRGVVDELISYFQSFKLPGKLAALDILGRIRPLHVVPWLEARLADPEADVRARACHALGCVGDPRSAPCLVGALTDEAWPVRAMAAKALGRIGRTEAIEPLTRALHDPEWWVRSNAARAVRGLGPPGAEALERTLDSDDRFAREQAVLMLEELGRIDERARGLISTQETERDRAVWFVKRLVTVGQTRRLHVLAQESPSAALRAALGALLPTRDAGNEETPK